MEEAIFVPYNRMRALTRALMNAWKLDRNRRHLRLFPDSMRFEEVELRPGSGNVAVY
jgi:hypothetical protein